MYPESSKDCWLLRISQDKSECYEDSYLEWLGEQIMDMGCQGIEFKEYEWLAFFNNEATAIEAKIFLEYFASNLNMEIQNFPRRNWNKLWEQEYQPTILFNGQIFVRAPHHIKHPFPKAEPKLDILIKPGMGFGTGHHPTTAIILESLMNVPLRSKNLLDWGCGSGILAIAASKLGAQEIYAIDIDADALENARENFLLNSITQYHLMEPHALKESKMYFDIILANINRNTLLDLAEEITGYAKNNTKLFLSGFYIEDAAMLMSCYTTKGWSFTSQKQLSNWCLLEFCKL